MAAILKDQRIRTHRAHVKDATKDSRGRSIYEPLFRESTMPGREAHYAKCPKCMQIVHIERPLPHGPPSDSFQRDARRAMDAHECSTGEQ